MCSCVSVKNSYCGSQCKNLYNIGISENDLTKEWKDSVFEKIKFLDSRVNFILIKGNKKIKEYDYDLQELKNINEHMIYNLKKVEKILELILIQGEANKNDG